MKILHITNSIDPATGGPASCVAELSAALNRLGHSPEIACLDAPGSACLARAKVPIYALGPVSRGFGYAPRLLPWLKAQGGRFDAVIVHGLWQYPGVAARLAFKAGQAPRRYVFPHGMLDPWFSRAHPIKHMRKWLYWNLIERHSLGGANAVLFTCEEESRLARKTFPGANYKSAVVSYGTATPPDNAETQREALFKVYPDLQYQPFWLFLGRVHSKKGIDMLIDAYGTLATASTNPLPRLVIAGPCAEPAYLEKLKAQAARVCPADSVVWPGMLSGDVKWGALRAAEVFILPSHQENFGIAVVEALACRTPVLISDQVNIHREIADDGAGLVEPDTAGGVLRLLRRWLEIQPDAHRAMRASAERCFHAHYEIGAVARSLVAAISKADQGKSTS